MWGVIEIPVWLFAVGGVFAAIAVLDRVLGPSVKWLFRRRFHRAVDRLNETLSLRIQPFKLMRRRALIDRLTYDPEVTLAAEEHIRETGMPRDLVIKQVEAYAREIVPSFSAMMYFGVGARVSRWISRFLYRVRLGAFDQDALSRIDPEASVVFVMNHRSNVDYLLVTYLAAQSSALSYAVGEWAQVWPLSRLIRAMGAYFIRRRSRDGLYRTVLRRYVQMATEGGVAQAIFPEGGLSRDGRLGPPKLGLLNYIVSGFDPTHERDVVFVPVGLNYDRVLEDRILIGAEQAKDGGARFKVSILRSAGFVARFIFGRLTGRYYKFGYACVSFGTPVSLRAFMEGRAGDITEHLGAALSERIAKVVPVLPTPLVATVLLKAGKEGVPETDITTRVGQLIEQLKGQQAHIHMPRSDIDYGVETGIRMLKLRRIIETRNGALVVAEGQDALLAYYANSILPAANS
ncbi:MAG: 1-acyl-sn-glycerol-3-phosphate acyltransferase [Pikeienuella sp.]